MQNGQKVATKIWQEIFNIQEGEQKNFYNNDIILKESASILLQLAAPRDSVYHFAKCAFEKNENT